jgi:hypothetical protein
MWIFISDFKDKLMIYSKPVNLVIKGLRFLGRVARRVRKNGASFYPECTDLTLENWDQNKHPTVFFSEKASDLVFEELRSDKPSMITRFGTTELSTVIAGVTPLTIQNSLNLVFGSAGITNIGIDDSIVNGICKLSGFFPNDPLQVERFVDLTMSDLKYIDILACWCVQEKLLEIELDLAEKIRFRDLEPYMHMNPWSRVLKGKKVLVIHPFVETIKEQYKKRELLFENPLVLPEFELKTIKAVQSIAGSKTQFSTWFDALESMKQQIDAEDFDIAIIGCGAYGMPLAAHVKRIGKKAVHLGGQTQLLFGIKGKRWETGHDKIKNMFNEHWVYPSELEKPKNFTVVEGGAYW